MYSIYCSDATAYLPSKSVRVNFVRSLFDLLLGFVLSTMMALFETMGPPDYNSDTSYSENCFSPSALKVVVVTIIFYSNTRNFNNQCFQFIDDKISKLY